jgi:hexosaminidase
VPAPLHISPRAGEFALNDRTVIRADGPPPVLRVAELLAERLRPATGYPLPITSGSGGDNAITLAARAMDAGLGDEGYALQVREAGIALTAETPAGLFYAAQTLRQLLPPQVESGKPLKSVRWTAPCVDIQDRPRFAVRGLMLDSSRHFQSVQFIQRTLDRMAYHKLNTFHWHLTDDQGWRIEIKKRPRLTAIGAWRIGEGGKPYPHGRRYGGYYTQDELREVVRYAAERHITIVPEIDMPGHTVSVLAAYPDLACTPGPFEVKTSWWHGKDVLCPGNPRVYEFAEDVLREVMDIFPGPVIHIGGDECPRDRWRECPKCQAKALELGLPNEDGLQNHFTRRITGFLREHGRRVQGWNEIMAGGDLPADVIVHQWNDLDAAASAIRAGAEVVDSMHTWLYFDYDHNATPLRKVFEYEPEPEGITPEQARRFLGVEACLWTEFRNTNAACDEYLWPRLIAFSELAWSRPDGRSFDGFMRRMRDVHYERVARMGLGEPGRGWVATRRRLLERSVDATGVVEGQ